MNHQTIIVLDFGGQYNQLIARRVRECGVYCEVKPYTTPLADLLAMKPIGFIFTGGPNSVYLEDAPHVDPALFDAGVPVLGICYGCQLIAHHLGGKVVAASDASAREYGKTETFFDTSCKLFKGLPEKSVTWMSHGDYMEKVPDGFSLVAHSDACPNVAICDEKRGFYGVQYHPEVNHTEYGKDMIRNFLYEVCGAKGDWTMGDYKNTAIAAVREKVGSGRVLLALSGGVDSSVVAALLAEAVGPQLTCVFVDHGLMRLNEGINRATRLVQQLLTLARLDPDSTKHPASTIKLDSLAHSVCEDMTPIASQKSITVTAVTKPASTEGLEDAVRLMMTNLTDNAVRYTPEGGRIEIRTRTDADTDGAVIEICDNGPGIAPEERERVFDRFYRALGTKTSGTGLGLAIVKRIVDIHHGTIAIDDGLDGRGTTFRIRLPKLGAAAAAV